MLLVSLHTVPKNITPLISINSGFNQPSIKGYPERVIVRWSMLVW